jgi:flagellar capping protein FliD
MHSDNAVHGVDKLIANFVKDYNDLRKEIVDKQTQEAGSVQKLLKKKAKRRYHELVLELERKTQAKNMELLPK